MKLFAGRCPRCGRAKDNTKKALVGLIGIQVVLLGLYVRGEWSWDLVGRTHEMRHVVLQAQSSAVRTAVPDPVAGWFYFQTSDSLMGDTTRHARLLSDSNPGMSNAGDQGTTGVIELRSSPLYGNSIVLTTKRAGLRMVDDHCEIEAEFDNADRMTFKAEVTVEGDTNVLVVEGYPTFVNKIAKSHVMALDVKLRPGAEQIVHFDVAGLIWE